jgi:SAM-dependent methyltransferase
MVTENSCEICGNKNDNEILRVREMYFGTREEFDYLNCSDCGCLQLINPPNDLSKYYSKDYFTYQQKPENIVKSWLNRFRDEAAMDESNFIGNILLKILGEPTYITRLKAASVSFKDKILDVGCGKGILLYKMKQSGFTDVMGVDPFIDETIVYKNGLKILKRNLSEISEKYDFIMFNHSFEHMKQPLQIMKNAYKLLNDEKFLLLRIPVCDSYAFRHYKNNWCSLDAPRHLFLHTKKSIKILADKSGFNIEKISYDSRSWQFWGSEQYVKNISLLEENSYYLNPKKSIFSEEEIRNFEEDTVQLNKIGEGDQAEFYLRKTN